MCHTEFVTFNEIGGQFLLDELLQIHLFKFESKVPTSFSTILIIFRNKARFSHLSTPPISINLKCGDFINLELSHNSFLSMIISYDNIL